MHRGMKRDHNAVWRIFFLELRCLCLALQLVTLPYVTQLAISNSAKNTNQPIKAFQLYSVRI